MTTAVHSDTPVKTPPEVPEASPLKASITLPYLKHALKIAGAAIDRTASIPVLHCVRMEQIMAGLAIEATDLDIYIRVIIGEESGPGKPLLIPAEKFRAWVNLLTGDDVKISATDRRATLQCGRARATLPVISAAQWPSHDIYALRDNGITLTQGDLSRALRFASIALCKEESRYVLNGVLLQGDGVMLRVVATDGHRLMVYALPCTDKITLLLPGRFVKTLLPLLTDEAGGVDLYSNASHILGNSRTDAIDISVGTGKLTGAFPNWEAVVPAPGRAIVTAHASDLLASLERCTLLSDDNTSLVKLTFSDGQIALQSASAAYGASEETIDCEGSPKKTIRVSINGEFLIDLLRKMEGDVRICPPDDSDSLSPLVLMAGPFDGASLTYVVSPMRA